VNTWRLRQIYEWLLKSEPSIVKLIENKSDLSKLSTLSELSIVKFIENQSEHLSKLTLYHLKKKRATRRSRRAREPSRIPLLFMQSRVPLGPGKFHVVVLVQLQSDTVISWCDLIPNLIGLWVDHNRGLMWARLQWVFLVTVILENLFWLQCMKKCSFSCFVLFCFSSFFICALFLLFRFCFAVFSVVI